MLKSILAQMPEMEFQKHSLNLSSNLHRLFNDLGIIQKKLVIGVFAPIQKEPLWFMDMEEKFEELTAYPTYVNGQMIYQRARLSELELGDEFGVNILRPKMICPEVFPEIVIVPGLGFSTDGKRLGRGKGFYDRYLENHPVVKVGIAFEMQMTKDILVESHDVIMDFVVTDQRVYKINR